MSYKLGTLESSSFHFCKAFYALDSYMSVPHQRRQTRLEKVPRPPMIDWIKDGHTLTCGKGCYLHVMDNGLK